MDFNGGESLFEVSFESKSVSIVVFIVPEALGFF